MNLYELEDQDLLGAYYSPDRDKINTLHIGDTRKPKITLRHLNRLKKMRAVEKLEKLQRQDLYSILYAQPEEQEGGPGGGMGF